MLWKSESSVAGRCYRHGKLYILPCQFVESIEKRGALEEIYEKQTERVHGDGDGSSVPIGCVAVKGPAIPRVSPGNLASIGVKRHDVLMPRNVTS
jgi:hypothetical protein